MNPHKSCYVCLAIPCSDARAHACIPRNLFGMLISVLLALQIDVARSCGEENLFLQVLPDKRPRQSPYVAIVCNGRYMLVTKEDLSLSCTYIRKCQEPCCFCVCRKTCVCVSFVWRLFILQRSNTMGSDSAEGGSAVRPVRYVCFVVGSRSACILRLVPTTCRGRLLSSAPCTTAGALFCFSSTWSCRLVHPRSKLSRSFWVRLTEP